jgi:hypothetical protein
VSRISRDQIDGNIIDDDDDDGDEEIGDYYCTDEVSRPSAEVIAQRIGIGREGIKSKAREAKGRLPSY